MQKILIIITSIILLIGTSIYFIFFYQSPVWDISYDITPSNTPLTYEQAQANIGQSNIKNAELYNTAMRDQNMILCQGITNEDKQTECRDMITATLAKKSGTIETCDTLTSTGVILLCRDAISSDRAIETQDRTICNHISGMDRRSYCKDQVDKVILTQHIEAHTVTREICNALGDHYETDCLSEIRELDESTLYRDAIAKNSTKLCEQITAPELRNTCRDTISLKTAVTTESTDLCETISDPEKKLYCQNQVSKTNDITLYKSAILGTNIESCTPIVNTSLRAKCHDSIIISRVKTEQNITLCESLTNTGMISSCQQIVQ
jgi:hypothetical protein